MLRVLLGILKGGIVGAGIGFGAFKLGLAGGALAPVVYGAVGFLVGIVCGRPIWRQETLWTPILKGIVGFALSLGLFFLARKVLGGFDVPFAAMVGAPADAKLPQVPQVLAPLIGIVYGVFVEFDDGGEAKAASAGKPGPAAPKA